MRDGSDAAVGRERAGRFRSLESSNVNIADAMVQMIELQRHFELQVKAMRTAEENAAAATQLLRAT